jgi:hypothetical protein
MNGRAGRGLAVLAAVATGVASLTLSCTTPESRLTMSVESYISAVTQRNDEGIAYMWGPFRRESGSLTPEEYKKRVAAFSVHVRQGNALFEKAKLEGSLAPDELGIPLFRALGMGKGAVSLPLSAHIEGDGLSGRVRTRVVTNLETLHLESLPDGVRIYLAGFPLGRLDMISVGFDEPSNHHLLESVDIEWRLSKAGEAVSTPAGWLIESIAADPNSAVEWKPKAKKG